MGTLVAGFSVVLAAIVAYVGWMGVRQTQLLRDCAALQRELDSQAEQHAETASRAA